MSTRAYRVVKIEVNTGASFNLWHDETLNDKLRNGGYYDNLDSGMFEISVPELKEIIEEIGKTINPDTLENLQKDIKATEAREEKYIQYYCF